MSLETLRDRIAIADLLQRYFTALDDKDYALLERVFVPGAKLHYEMRPGTPPSSYPEMVEAFRDFNAGFLLTQHMMGHPVIELDGDAARSRTSLRAIHVQLSLEGERNLWVVHGFYRDRHLRGAAGWRIAERYFRSLHTEGTLLPRDRVRRFEAAPDSASGDPCA